MYAAGLRAIANTCRGMLDAYMDRLTLRVLAQRDQDSVELPLRLKIETPPCFLSRSFLNTPGVEALAEWGVPRRSCVWFVSPEPGAASTHTIGCSPW
eukprot:3474854-Pyramimonas_sp.AAC.1